MNKITIRYCTQCNWMLRSSWMAQELLHTFSDDIDELALQPASGGVFSLSASIDDKEHLLWERTRDGGFPDIKQLKQIVRAVICPQRDLGYIDR